MNKRRKKDDTSTQRDNQSFSLLNYDLMNIDNPYPSISHHPNEITYKNGNNSSIMKEYENMKNNQFDSFNNIDETTTKNRKYKHHMLTNEEIEEFYDSLKSNKQYRLSKLPQLSTTLYPYQKQAIGWMIQMEKRNKIQGGILADETGLGKTIEVLGLILSHIYDSKSAKVKSDTSNLIDLPATLIICPSVLIKHWRQEIKKHCPQLNAWVYQGIGGLSAKHRDLVKNNKNLFQKRDIVITSYEVLSKDFNFTLSPRVKTRNSISDVGKTQSPLTLYRWWRVCMDEAHMCATVSSQTARMILKISSIHRWAITGTPINKDFEDIKGLLVFLDCEEQWYQSRDKLLNFLRTIMWRSSKSNISQNIITYEKKENEISVDLPDIERYAYTRILKSKKNESKDLSDWELFSSAPFCTESLSKVASAGSFKKYKYLLNLTKELNEELCHLQLELCKKLNQLGDILYSNNDYEGAIKVFQISYDISLQNKESKVFPNLQSETQIGHAGHVGYHSIRGIKNSNEKLGKYDDLKELTVIEKSCKSRALASEEFQYLSALESFKIIKKEISRLMRNRMNYQRDPWWICALNYLNKNQKDFLFNLKEGVEQQYDTKFHGYRRSILQLNVEGIDDIIDLLKREFDIIDETRKEFLKHCLFEIDIDEENPMIYEQMLEEAENYLNKYQRCLVYNSISEDCMLNDNDEIELNIAERVLMYIEYCIILDYNPTMKAYLKRTLTSNQIKKLNELSFFLLMSETHFKELELMKLEIEAADRLLKEKKKYIQHLNQLNIVYNSADLDKETLMIEIREIVKLLQEKQWEVEFVGNESKKEIPLQENYGKKLSIAVKLIQNSLQNPKDKALVFSYRVEALVQLARLLDYVNIQYRFGKETGKANASAGTLKQRLEAFRTHDNIKVLLLNSHSLSSTLTLSQANHVIFLDPVGHSNEEKVIGYLNRIGQDKCLNIYRFKVNNIDFKKPKFNIPLELEKLLV